jgi:hypothetical protein
MDQERSTDDLGQESRVSGRDFNFPNMDQERSTDDLGQESRVSGRDLNFPIMDQERCPPSSDGY